MSARLAAGWSADLATAVLERLAVLDQAAAGVRERTEAELARLRQDLAGQIAAWRRLLTAHMADERGRCPRCRGWLRSRRWPCGVWTTAHASLITSGVVVGVPAAPGRVLVPWLRETGAPPRPGAFSTPRARPGSFVVRTRPGGAR